MGSFISGCLFLVTFLGKQKSDNIIQEILKRVQDDCIISLSPQENDAKKTILSNGFQKIPDFKAATTQQKDKSYHLHSQHRYGPQILP